MPTNILVLSAGTRNKVIQAFKQELANNGKVFATDCSNIGPAIYDADEAIIVPRIKDPFYIDEIPLKIISHVSKFKRKVRESVLYKVSINVE